MVHSCCFYFNIHGDEALAQRLHGEIQQFHPDADIVAIADGPLQSPIPWAIEGEHLKTHGSIVRFIHRNLTEVLARSEAEVFIKVDPDTYLLHPLDPTPTAPWAGRVGLVPPRGLPWVTEPGRFCSGFCWAMQRGTMEALLQSIGDPVALEETYASPHNLYRRRKDRTVLVPHEDFVIAHLLQKVGVEPTLWPELAALVEHRP